MSYRSAKPPLIPSASACSRVTNPVALEQRAPRARAGARGALRRRGGEVEHGAVATTALDLSRRRSACGPRTVSDRGRASTVAVRVPAPASGRAAAPTRRSSPPRPRPGPRAPPQRLGWGIDLAQQVVEERRPRGQPGPQKLHASPPGASRPGPAGRPIAAASSRKYSAHATRAPERARARPYELPEARSSTSSQVCESAPVRRREHVPLPRLGGERESLQGNQDLAQAVDTGACGWMAVHALPGGQKGREASPVGGLDLLAQRGSDARRRRRSTSTSHQSRSLPPACSSPITRSPARSSSRRTAPDPRGSGARSSCVLNRPCMRAYRARSCTRASGRPAGTTPAGPPGGPSRARRDTSPPRPPPPIAAAPRDAA